MSAALSRAGSVIGLRSLAKCLPLLSVVAAQDGGAALFQAPNLRQRLQKHLRVRRVAWNDVPIERGAQADRIGGKQKLATAVEPNERAHRPLVWPGSGISTMRPSLKRSRSRLIVSIGSGWSHSIGR